MRALIVFAILTAACCLPSTAGAATRVVTQCGDSGPGSLRDTIATALDGDTVDAGSCFLDHELVQAGFGRRKENPIRMIFQSFVTTKHTYQPVNFIVIRFYVIVANWPVVTQSIDTAPFEIFWSEA